MVTEELCQQIVARMHGKSCALTRTLHPSGGLESTLQSVHRQAVSRDDLYGELLLKFDIREIDDAVSWLKVRGFISAFGVGMASEMGFELTEKGIRYGSSRMMDDQDRRRLSSRPVSVNPELYGVSVNLKEVWWRIRRIFGNR